MKPNLAAELLDATCQQSMKLREEIKQLKREKSSLELQLLASRLSYKIVNHDYEQSQEKLRKLEAENKYLLKEIDEYRCELDVACDEQHMIKTVFNLPLSKFNRPIFDYMPNTR
jgi:chromosome segregation ATPase